MAEKADRAERNRGRASSVLSTVERRTRRTLALAGIGLALVLGVGVKSGCALRTLWARRTLRPLLAG